MQGAGDGQGAGSRGIGGSWFVQTATGRRGPFQVSEIVRKSNFVIEQNHCLALRPKSPLLKTIHRSGDGLDVSIPSPSRAKLFEAKLSKTEAGGSAQAMPFPTPFSFTRPSSFNSNLPQSGPLTIDRTGFSVPVISDKVIQG